MPSEASKVTSPVTAAPRSPATILNLAREYYVMKFNYDCEGRLDYQDATLAPAGQAASFGRRTRVLKNP